ncbi:response regulator [Methylobacterium sp. JK268]
MAERSGDLDRCRILVAEDEYLLADDLAQVLARAGAEVIGPVGTGREALALLAARTVDAAILDIGLREADGFAIADLLSLRRIPFVFATGYSRLALPDAYRSAPVFEKPVDYRGLVAHLSDLTRGTGRSRALCQGAEG